MTPSRLNPLTALALTALCGALLPNLAQAAAPQPGQVFKDCKDCPEKRSTVIEHRLYGNSGCVAVDSMWNAQNWIFASNSSSV